jgi:hypothetical protein
MEYRLTPGAEQALGEYIERRRSLPAFANARSIRNALDRARLRQAGRLVGRGRQMRLSREELMLLEATDIRSSRVFSGAPAQGSAP